MNKNEQGVNLVDLLVYLASKWKWFLLSVLICVGFAWYKYASAPLVYFGKATVIIKDLPIRRLLQVWTVMITLSIR